MYKKIVLFLLTVSTVYPVFSQDELERKLFNQEVKLDVFPLFNNAFGMAYEYYLLEASSVQGEISMILLESDFENRIGTKIEGQYRFYAYSDYPPYEMYFSGIYVAPYLQYEYLNLIENPGSTLDKRNNYFMSVRGGLLIGIQYIIFERFVLEMSLGGGIKYTIDKSPFLENEYNSNFTEPAYNGIVPKSHLLVGIRF